MGKVYRIQIKAHSILLTIETKKNIFIFQKFCLALTLDGVVLSLGQRVTKIVFFCYNSVEWEITKLCTNIGTNMTNILNTIMSV